jgi:hypothetical protein
MSLLLSEYFDLNSRWAGHVTTTFQLNTDVVKGLRLCAIKVLSPCCRLTTTVKDWHYVNLLPQVGRRFAGWWGRLSVKSRYNGAVLNFLLFPRSDFLCGNGTPFFFNVSIMWFSGKLGVLIKNIGACTLRAQWTPSSAMRAPSIAY